MPYSMTSMPAKPGHLLHWLILVLCLAWSMPALAADSDEYLREARDYFDRGELSAAIIQLKNALLIDPENSEVRLLLGKAYVQQKDGLSAEKELRRAQELGAARESVLLLLGRALLMTGQNDKLLQTISPEAGDADAFRADILTLQGQAYLASGKLAMAEEKFSAALDRQPGATDALLGKARIAYQNKDTEVAFELVNKGLSDAPDNAKMWILNGELLRDTGKHEEAVAAFKRALDIDPDSVPARIGRATALLARSKPEEASADIDWLLENRPDLYQTDYLNALLQYLQRQTEPAQESVQRALKRYPGFPPAQLLAGTLAYQLGQLNQAEQHLRSYWKRDPGNLQATRLLATILLKLREPGKAIDVLEPGVHLAKADARYLSLLGVAYLGRGDNTKGMEYLQQAAAIAPDVAGIRTQIALGEMAQGNMEQGISELQSAVELDQGLVQADVLLVLAHLQRRDFDAALVVVETLAGKMPDSPVPSNLKGEALMGKGDLPAAKQAFTDAARIQPEFLPAQFNLARLEVLDGNTTAAASRYKAILARDEGNVNAMMALAALASHRGDNDATERWLKQAHTHQPQAVKPALLLLAHYLQQGDRQRARDIAGGLVAAHPRDPRVLKAVAQVHIQSGDYAAATDTLRSLVEVSPESAEARYQLGMLQLKQNQAGDARASLSRALELQPDFPAAQLALARLDIFEKDYDAALKFAAELAKAHSDAAFADELRGDVAAARQTPQAAAEAYALAYEKTASAQLVGKLYQSYTRIGDTESALAILKQWLDANPLDVPVRSRFAQALLGAGRYPQAIDEYLLVIKQNPANVTALNNIAWLYQQQGNYPEGIKYAERAYELVPERPEVTDTLGWLLVLNGETNRGLVLLQEARIKAPHIPDIHYHMAVALEKAGRREEARKEINRLLKSNKTFTGRDEAEAFRDQLGG